MRLFYFLTIYSILIFSNCFSAEYVNSTLGVLNSSRTGGTCTAANFPAVNLNNVKLSISNRTTATLSFSNNTSGTSLNLFSQTGTISGSTINFSGLTATRGACSAAISFSITGINIGVSSFTATINMSVAGAQTGSASTNLALTYVNGSQPRGTFASINTSDIVNGAICTNSQFSVDIDGDHFGSVYIEIDNNRIGNIVPSENNFNINTVFLRNSFAGLSLGINNATHTIRLVLLNADGSLIRKIDINTTIKSFTPFANVSITSTPANGLSCYGEPIAFQSNISGAGYKWSDGSNAGQFYTVNNPQNGFGYSVTVTNNGVCPVKSNTITANVIANFNPTISASKTQACEGETVTLTAQPNDPNQYNYQWANASIGNTVSVTMSSQWDLKITPKAGCATKMSPKVDINFIKTVTGQKINLPAGKTKAIFCTNETSMLLTAGADDLTGAAYQWSNSAGSVVGTGSTLPVTQGGTYSLVLSKSGCSTPPVPITVIGNTTPVINPTPADARECNGKTVVLNSAPNDKGNFTYEWQKDGTVISGQTEPSYSATTVGSYKLVLKPIGGGCTQFSEVSRSVTIDPTINGKLSPNGNAVICNATVGLNLTASGEGTGAINYAWNTGATSPTLNVKTAGTFTVTMTRGKCTETQSVTTKVENLTASITDANGKAVESIIVCSGSNFQDYALKASSNFTAATFKWKQNTDNTDAPNATNTNTYSPRTAGDYYVFAEVASLGCTAPSPSNKIKVIVPTNFAIAINPANPTPICDGFDQKFVAEPTYAGNSIAYSWSGNGISSVAKEITTNIAGQYSVKISQEGCQASSTVTLNTKPSKPTITVVDEVFLKSSLSSDGRYAWYFKKTAAEAFNESATPEAATQDFTVINPSKIGFYAVKSNREGCGQKLSDPVEIKFFLTSTNPNSLNPAFKVYPNPILQNVVIDDEQSLNKTIELFDINGRLIKKWQSTDSKTNLNIEDIGGGVYQLIIQSNEKKTVKKLYKM